MIQMEAHRYREASTGYQQGGEEGGAIQRWGSGRHTVSVRWKMSSRMHCTTWRIEPGLCNNYKRKANFTNCTIRKGRKRGEEGGKKGRKRMAFLEVKKPILIRPFLAKEFINFFNLLILIGG